MKKRQCFTAVLLVFVMFFSVLFTGCDGKTIFSKDNYSQLTNNSYPMVLFGEKIVSTGMSYSLNSEEKFKTGSMVGKEYVKLNSDMELSFKLDNEFAEKLSGKNVFIKFEYFESNSKSYSVTYKSADGDKTEKIKMSSSSKWGGVAIRAKKVKIDSKAQSHFTLKLDKTASMWLRSVSVVEDTTTESKYPQLLETKYESSNGKIIEANIKDYGAVGDGNVDDSIAFQAALRDMDGRGGILYVPAGTYKLTQDLIIPKGVTILGDFNKPSIENPKAGGTILAAYVPTIADGNTSLFMSMNQGSCAKGLTIWYPEQTLESGEAEPYNYTIGIMGAINVSIEDIYLVNSYNGITHASYDNAHYQQMIKNIYGTPLKTGHLTGRASDSDRHQNFNFSPEYWLGSGLANIPDENVLRTWLLNYAVGLSIGRIDFHYVSDINIDGYKTGIHMFSFYGRLYNLNITNCNVCLYVEKVVLYGGQLTKAVLKADGGKDPVALLVGEGVEYGFSGTMLDVSSTGKYAISHLGTGEMSITDSKISVTGKNSVAPLYIADGRVSIMNSEFNGGSKQILVGNNADESSILNCTSSSGELKVEDNSDNKVIFDTLTENEGPLASEVLNVVDDKRAYQVRKPKTQKLYNIADYGIPEGEQPEISVALQKAIDDASKNGGGYVYIPASVYRLESPVTVKTGVEIVGVSDYFHYVNDTIPTSAILTDYGKGNINEPLIKIEENSGIRGLSIIYDKVAQENIQKYATTVQATGKNCYTINTTIVGAWNAVDYDTYKCDNHYIESVNFFAFNRGIAVGGGSTGGVVLNGHSNPGEMWSTGFNKSEWDTARDGKLIVYQIENAVSFYYGNCTDQVAFMTATFGYDKGIMIEGADITIIGHGSDFSTNDIFITGNSNVNIFDPQCIGVDKSTPYYSTAIVCDKNFTGTANIYNMCPWNIKDAVVRVDNGNLSINGGYFSDSGKSPVIASGGNVTMRGVIVRSRSSCDLQALNGVKSITAYGNIILGTPTFKIESTVKTYGSDIK